MRNRSAKDTAVFFDEIQVRSQVFRRNQGQFFQRTGLQLFYVGFLHIRE